MKIRAKTSVSIREKAVRMIQMQRSANRSIDTMRVECESMTTVGIDESEGDMIRVAFMSPGLWGFLNISKSQAIQLALNILRACGAENLVKQEAA